MIEQYNSGNGSNNINEIDEEILLPSYELWLHWKQGDDFAGCLKEANDNVPAALELWAQHFDGCAEHCRSLAKELEGADVSADGDVHYIRFDGDEVLMEKLVSMELLNRVDWE